MLMVCADRSHDALAHDSPIPARVCVRSHSRARQSESEFSDDEAYDLEFVRRAVAPAQLPPTVATERLSDPAHTFARPEFEWPRGWSFAPQRNTTEAMRQGRLGEHYGRFWTLRGRQNLPAALREVAMTLALVANRLEMRAPLTHSRLPCLPWNTCWATVLQFLRAPDFPAFELRRAVEGWSVREPMLIEASALGNFEARIKLVMDHIYDLSANVVSRPHSERLWRLRPDALAALCHLDTPEHPVSWLLLRPPWVSLRCVKALAAKYLDIAKGNNAGVMYSVAKLRATQALDQGGDVSRAREDASTHLLMEAARGGCSDAIADVRRRWTIDPLTPPLQELIAMVIKPNWNIINVVCQAHSEASRWAQAAVVGRPKPKLTERVTFARASVRQSFLARVIAAEIAAGPDDEVLPTPTPGISDADLRSDPHFKLYSLVTNDTTGNTATTAPRRFKMSSVQQSVSFRKREILLDWMLDVTLEVSTLAGVKRRASCATLHTAAGLVDLFMASQVQIPRSCFQLVGAAALVIATRYHTETQPLSMRTAVYYADGAFSYTELAATMGEMLVLTKGRVHRPTAIDFLDMFRPSVDVVIASLAEAMLIVALVARSSRFESQAMSAAAAVCLASALESLRRTAGGVHADVSRITPLGAAEVLPGLAWTELSVAQTRAAAFAMYLLCFTGDAYGTPHWAFPWLAHDGADDERSVRGLCAPLVADALPGIAAVGFEAVAAALYPGGRPRDTSDIAAFAEYFDGYKRDEWDVLHGQQHVMNYIESVIADALTIDYLATLYG